MPKKRICCFCLRAGVTKGRFLKVANYIFFIQSNVTFFPKIRIWFFYLRAGVTTGRFLKVHFLLVAA
jgi:hypothetical protein